MIAFIADCGSTCNRMSESVLHAKDSSRYTRPARDASAVRLPMRQRVAPLSHSQCMGKGARPLLPFANAQDSVLNCSALRRPVGKRAKPRNPATTLPLPSAAVRENALNPAIQPRRGCRPPPPRGKTRFTPRFRRRGSFVEGSAGLGRLPGGLRMFSTEITACHGAFSALNALFLPRNVGAGGFGGFRSEIRVSPCGKNVLNSSASLPARGKAR